MGFNPVDLAFGNMNALRSGNERLRAENVKLRELCWELFEAERIGTTSDYWHELCGRARELGIEVDE